MNAPPSILFASAAAAALWLFGFFGLAWGVITWITGRPYPYESLTSILGVLGLWEAGVFIARLRRRRAAVRVPGIAGALAMAAFLAILALVFAVAPRVVSRPVAIGLHGSLALLFALVGYALTRPSARAWLTE